MAAGAIVARILTQYSDKGSKQAQKDIAKLSKRIDAFAKTTARNFAIAGAASAAFAVKIGTDAVKAAIEEQRSQAILANTLKNVAGATDATIKKVDEYIDKQEMLSTVSDTELRASFGRLVSISGDVTEAMRVQTVALDTAAGTTKDLSTVSAAFEKAVAGNFTALKKVLPGINANIIKNKDLGKALEYATMMYGGAAKEFGDTEPLKRLQIAYGRVLETLGAALLPVVIDFTEYIVEELLPALDDWIRVNETELQDSLKGVSTLFKLLIDNSGNLTKTLDLLVSISNFLNTSILGVIKWGEALFGIFVIGRLGAGLNKIFGGINKEVLIGGKRFDVAAKNAGKIGTVLSKFGTYGRIAAAGIGLINTAFITLRTTAIGAAIATAFATGGVSLGTAGLALAAIGITAVTAKLIMGDYTKQVEKTTTATVDMSKQIYGGAAAVKYQAEVEAAAAKKRAIARAIQQKAEKAAAAEAAKKAAIEAKTAALKAQIEKKYGVKLTSADEYENIQLTAVEKLLAKQKDADKTLTDRIKLRREELALFNALNQNAQRYTDLLQALADEKLSNEEIQLLAKKWGLTVDAAKSYIYTIFAIKDEVVSDDEVARLAEAWGVTKAQAGQYLDFFAALNDGKLSDAEIAKLMTKWGLTKEEAVKYSDFVSKLGDGQLSQKDLDDLKSNWGLTNEQVVEYIKQIGVKVDASGTILSAGDIAALGWTNALNALNAYLAALGKGTGGTPQNPVIPPVVVPIVPKPGDGTGLGGSRTDAAATKAAAASSKAAAEYASAMAAGNIDAAAKAAAKVAPSELASQESGAIGALSISRQLAEAEKARKNTVSNFRAAEALSAMNDAVASRDYDEKFRFMGSSTLDTSKSLMASGMNNSSGTTNVYLTVQGTVTAEQDLVQTVRNGLLAAQTNGQGLTLQAI